MTPQHQLSDNGHTAVRTPVPTRPTQQRASEQQATAKIDATEFWRRLGL